MAPSAWLQSPALAMLAVTTQALRARLPHLDDSLNKGLPLLCAAHVARAARDNDAHGTQLLNRLIHIALLPATMWYMPPCKQCVLHLDTTSIPLP